MYKNIALGRELQGDVLRQRRDLYATSLGLILFHIAGAGVRNEAVLTTVPVHLSDPEVLYWSACAALIYFLFRYWMVAPNAFEKFNEEWRLQTLASKKYEALIREGAAVYVDNPTGLLSHLRSGVIPDYDQNVRTIQWNRLLNLKKGGAPASVYLRVTKGGSMTDDEFDNLKIAIRRGFLRAIFLERTVMDIIVPYAVAALAIAVVIYSWF